MTQGSRAIELSPVKRFFAGKPLQDTILADFGRRVKWPISEGVAFYAISHFTQHHSTQLFLY
jgi:hypothetical protein